MLDGTYRPRAHDNGADTRSSIGKCVPLRKLNKYGRRFFDSVIRAYPAGTLGESDSEALTACAEWVQAQYALEAGKQEMEFRDYIRQKGEISKHFLQHAVRFGLTPADRGKVKLTGPPEGEAKEAKFFGATG